MSIDLDAATPTTPEHQAEQALLAAMLLSENAVHTIMSRVDADDFSPGFNQAVFGAMVDLIENGSNIDIAPVTGRLMEMGQEDPEGIKTFLLDIARTRPMAKTVKSSIGVIKEAARRRKISAAADNVRLLATTGGDIEGAMQEMILASSTQTSGQVIGIGAGAELMIEHLQAPIVKHVRTGLPDLDHLLNGGFRPGQLITVGARPGVGKSAFALGIAYQAVKDGLHVLYVTAEMGVAELLLRLLARTTKIPLSVLTSVDVANELSPGEWDKIGKEAQSWVNYHMDFIDDAPTVLQIRSKAKAAEAQGQPYNLIVIDYLQLLEAPKGKESRQTEVSAMSRAMKQMAREIGAPVVSLAQLNRDVEKRADKKPMLTDLRESGSLEQDSDVVMFLNRPEIYDPDESPGTIEQIIAKQRSGPMGITSGTFLGEYAAIVPMIRQEDETQQW